MPRRDGAMIYSDSLTNNQENFCQLVVSGKNNIDAFIEAYPNISNLSKNALECKCKRLVKQEKIIKRINELEQINKIKGNNQILDQNFIFLKNNTKDYLLMEFYELVKSCKYDNDRPNQLKALENIAKIMNIYGDNSTITNTQLNNIIINTKDVNSAIDQIHKLVNKQ